MPMGRIALDSRQRYRVNGGPTCRGTATEWMSRSPPGCGSGASVSLWTKAAIRFAWKGGVSDLALASRAKR